MAVQFDGYPIRIGFSLDANFFIGVKEKALTPPGMSTGGSIDIATMRSNIWRQKWPKALYDFMETTFNGAHDPEYIYLNVRNMLGFNQTISIEFPSGDVLSFDGFLEEAKLNEYKEGDQPIGVFKITPTMTDNSGNETDYAFQPA